MMIAMAAFFFVSCSGNSEGEKAVNELCKAFDYMSKQVNDCNNIFEAANINFSEAIEHTDLENVPDSALNYELTNADKDKIKKAVNRFIDSVQKLTAESAGMDFDDPYIVSTFDSLRSSYEAAIDKATTFESLAESMERL